MPAIASPWLFNENGKERDIMTTGSYSCSEDVLGGVTLTRNGAGLFQTYRYNAEDDLRRGHVVEVLQAFNGRSRPFNVMYPHGKLLPSRVGCLSIFDGGATALKVDTSPAL